MLSDREKRIAAILQRLAEWNTQMLDDHPVQVLKHIVGDAEKLLDELKLPRFPARPPKERASETSSGTPEPSKTPPPEDH